MFTLYRKNLYEESFSKNQVTAIRQKCVCYIKEGRVNECTLFEGISMMACSLSIKTYLPYCGL
jgi:hypothetical protein